MTNIDIYKIKEAFSNSVNQDYLIEYTNLINENKDLQRIKGETENHHIFPKSIFGKNKITINLPIKLHFRAHILLWKMYSSIDKTTPSSIKMACAVHKMTQGRYEFTEEDYDMAREAIVEARSGKSTVYDKSENKYYKLNAKIIDNIRYFSVKMYAHKTTKIKKWLSDQDPKLCEYTKTEPHQAYRNILTNEMQYIPVRLADPKLWIHANVGNKFKKIPGTSRQRYYNSINDCIVVCNKTEAQLNGYTGCATYVNTVTGKSDNIPKAWALREPFIWKHVNSGKIDVFMKNDPTQTKAKKIPLCEYNSDIHINVSKKLSLERQLLE